MRKILTVGLALALLVATACSDERGDATPTTAVPGEDAVIASYGSIDRSSGTPAVVSDYILKSMTCADGVFRMGTSQGAFVGKMECQAMPPDLVIAGFGEKPITIQITSTRLKIGEIAAGTLDLPVSGAVLEE